MHAPRVRRRLIPAVLLVLVLALVPTLSAQAFPLDLTLRVQGLWSRVVDAIAQVWARADTHRVPAGAFIEEGAISPDGTSAEADSATEPEGAFTEEGAGISPDG